MPPCKVNPGAGESIPGKTACWLPELGPVANRAVSKRNRIVTLSGVLGRAGAALTVGVTPVEAEMMEVIEDELKEIRPHG